MMCTEKAYTFFSGNDFRFHITSPLLEKETVLFIISGVSVIQNLESNKCEGSILVSLVDCDLVDKIGKVGLTIRIVAANEYGEMAECIISGVRLTKRRWAVAVDDIIPSSTIDFEADNICNWKKVMR